MAPYWVNFDIRQFGSISYEIHSTITGKMSIVNNFIQQQEDEEFEGTWMMVASFNEVPQLDSINKVSRHTLLLSNNTSVSYYYV